MVTRNLYKVKRVWTRSGENSRAVPEMVESCIVLNDEGGRVSDDIKKITEMRTDITSVSQMGLVEIEMDDISKTEIAKLENEIRGLYEIIKKQHDEISRKYTTAAKETQSEKEKTSLLKARAWELLSGINAYTKTETETIGWVRRREVAKLDENGSVLEYIPMNKDLRRAIDSLKRGLD